MYKPKFQENRELAEATAATQVITHIEEAIEILEQEGSEMSRKSVAHLREKLQELQKLFKSKIPAKAKKEDKPEKEEKEDEIEETEEESEGKETPELKEGNEFQMNPMGGDEDEEEEEETDTDEGPQEEDIAVESSGPLGSRFSVGIVNGRHIGEFKNAEEVNEAIDAYKRRSPDFFPTVWFIDDHGGHTVWNESTKAPYKPKFN